MPFNLHQLLGDTGSSPVEGLRLIVCPTGEGAEPGIEGVIVRGQPGWGLGGLERASLGSHPGWMVSENLVQPVAIRRRLALRGCLAWLVTRRGEEYVDGEALFVGRVDSLEC